MPRIGSNDCHAKLQSKKNNQKQRLGQISNSFFIFISSNQNSDIQINEFLNEFLCCFLFRNTSKSNNAVVVCSEQNEQFKVGMYVFL